MSFSSCSRTDKGKPGESRGRKVKGLRSDFGFRVPSGRLDFGLVRQSQGHRRLRFVRVCRQSKIQNPKSKIEIRSPDYRSRCSFIANRSGNAPEKGAAQITVSVPDFSRNSGEGKEQ